MRGKPREIIDKADGETVLAVNQALDVERSPHIRMGEIVSLIKKDIRSIGGESIRRAITEIEARFMATFAETRVSVTG